MDLNNVHSYSGGKKSRVMFHAPSQGSGRDVLLKDLHSFLGQGAEKCVGEKDRIGKMTGGMEGAAAERLGSCVESTRCATCNGAGKSACSHSSACRSHLSNLCTLSEQGLGEI